MSIGRGTRFLTHEVQKLMKYFMVKMSKTASFNTNTHNLFKENCEEENVWADILYGRSSLVHTDYSRPRLSVKKKKKFCKACSSKKCTDKTLWCHFACQMLKQTLWICLAFLYAKQEYNQNRWRNFKLVIYWRFYENIWRIQILAVA